MPEPVAEPLDIHTPLADLTSPVLVEYSDATSYLFEFTRATKNRTDVRVRATSNGAGGTHHNVLRDQPLGDFAVAALQMRPIRALQLPDDVTLRVPDEARARPKLSLAGTIGTAALIGVVTAAFTQSWVASLIAIALLVVAVVAGGRSLGHWMHGTPATLTVGGSTFNPADLFEAAQTALPAAEGVREHSIAELKAEYGRLLSDILYRLENPALFDVAVPTTRKFTTALLLWDDTADDLPPLERAELAAEVHLTFDAARAHAETVGINHAAEADREQIARAAKAIRLAQDSDNRAEQQAARRQAIRILHSLALYYLPDPDEAEALVAGRQILALPGRREDDE